MFYGNRFGDTMASCRDHFRAQGRHGFAGESKCWRTPLNQQSDLQRGGRFLV